ncbi:MAG: hypothetical protein ACPGWS_04530, partial [Solirubrobacterales bacterium]
KPAAKKKRATKKKAVRRGTPPWRSRLKWVPKFFEELRMHGNATRAAQAAGVTRRVIYATRDRNAEFAEEWDDAVDESADNLELEAFRRAHDGVQEPVFYKGAECGTIRKFSDTLLIFLLKARRPKVYRDRHLIENQLDQADVEKIIGELSEDVKRIVKDPKTLKAIQDAWASHAGE